MRYKVLLSAHGNIDHGENPYETLAGVDRGYKEADTIEELQSIVRKYIDDNDLGSGNWTGGKVFDGDEEIGYISYNGRYWTTEELKQRGWA